MTWITGDSGAGKTTLAKRMIAKYGGILLDGDDMRRCWQLGFGREDRIENNLRIGAIAQLLESQGFLVIVATICPYPELRTRLAEMCNPHWIHLSGGSADRWPLAYEAQ